MQRDLLKVPEGNLHVVWNKRPRDEARGTTLQILMVSLGAHLDRLQIHLFERRQPHLDDIGMREGR